MKSVFVAYVITAALLITVTAIVGTMVNGQNYFDHHFALGLVATLFLCLGHCVVFTYFMATGKMIRLAIEEAELDVQLFERARQYKMRAYRALMSAVIMALAVGLSGGWITYHANWAKVHLLCIVAGLATQLTAWWMEFQAITDNGRLMDEVFDRHARMRGTHEVRHMQ